MRGGGGTHTLQHESERAPVMVKTQSKNKQNKYRFTVVKHLGKKVPK